jgi:murein endopeptidase
MTVYDLVVIADTLSEAEDVCQKWANGKQHLIRWAAIRPDMLRHFENVGARNVMCCAKKYDREQAAQLLARGRNQMEVK